MAFKLTSSGHIQLKETLVLLHSLLMQNTLQLSCFTVNLFFSSSAIQFQLPINSVMHLVGNKSHLSFSAYIVHEEHVLVAKISPHMNSQSVTATFSVS